MSVLIKGINIPQDCGNCWFELCTGKYPQNCPLVEVPTPHGRLIDADELEVDTEWSDYYDGFQSYSAMQIKYAPTVIESEE